MTRGSAWGAGQREFVGEKRQRKRKRALKKCQEMKLELGKLQGYNKGSASLTSLFEGENWRKGQKGKAEGGKENLHN